MSSWPPTGRRHLPPPPSEFRELAPRSPARAIVLGAIALLLILGCGYGALTVQADISQPVASGKVACTNFTVNPGESASSILDRLEQAHLIRNSTILKLYLKVSGKSLNVQQGIYCLSPSMSVTDIINTLNTAPNAAYVQFTVPDADRLIQFPGDILGSAVLHDPGQKDDGAKGQKALPNFKASDFLNITVKTGNFPGISQYWYVKPWVTGNGHSLTALEGYLAPNTYQIDPASTATDVIKRMLNGLGEELCPGPNQSQLDMYIFDKQQCMAHQATITPPAIPSPYQATVAKPMGIFDALKKYYDPDPVKALQEALIIGSFSEREARHAEHFFLVSSVYYNRYKKPNNETVGLLNADPAEQYWLGNAQNPWPTLQTLPSNMANNPYNLYITPGLSPSAISSPSSIALYSAMLPPSTPYYYFFYSNCDHTNHYDATLAQFSADQNAHTC